MPGPGVYVLFVTAGYLIGMAGSYSMGYKKGQEDALGVRMSGSRYLPCTAG
jgi:hypothetical protein